MSKRLFKKLTKKDFINEVKGYLFMFIGCVMYGSSTALFLEPNGIIAGGITGLSVLLSSILKTPLSVGTWIILLNVPLIIMGFKSQGLKFILRCLITIITLGLVTDLIEVINIAYMGVSESGSGIPATSDKVLASLYGGVFQGVGIGLFVKYQFSSGGTELLARIISNLVKVINIPFCLCLIDGSIVVLGAYWVGIENILHALIVVFVSAKVSEIILMGMEKSKLCIIITEKGEEVSKTLIEHSPRGVTMLEGEGMYSHKDKDVLLTCVKNNQLTEVKSLLYSVDPLAFIIINDSVEVRGQGFKSLKEDNK